MKSDQWFNGNDDIVIDSIIDIVIDWMCNDMVYWIMMTSDIIVY